MLTFRPLVAEFIGTFALVFVVAGTVGALYVGLWVTLGTLMGDAISGAGMNPARYLGPALFSGELQYAWVYWLGPLAGGGLAALLYHHVLEIPEP